MAEDDVIQDLDSKKLSRFPHPESDLEVICARFKVSRRVVVGENDCCKILVGSTEKIEAAEICDCAAGSGSLILHLAHELGQENGMNRALVYTQDISAKSSRFLRLNLMLNGMMESLGNVVQGDTLLNPSHFAIEGDPTSGLKKWDYQTINPPFKMDFSSTRDQIEAKWHDTDRFFAGVPKIPNAKKDSIQVFFSAFLAEIWDMVTGHGKGERGHRKKEKPSQRTPKGLFLFDTRRGV